MMSAGGGGPFDRVGAVSMSVDIGDGRLWEVASGGPFAGGTPPSARPRRPLLIASAPRRVGGGLARVMLVIIVY